MERKKFICGILVGLLIGALCFSIICFVTKDKKCKVSGNGAVTEEQSGNVANDKQNRNIYSYSLSKRGQTQFDIFDYDGDYYYITVDRDGKAYLNLNAGSNSTEV